MITNCGINTKKAVLTEFEMETKRLASKDNYKSIINLAKGENFVEIRAESYTSDNKYASYKLLNIIKKLFIKTYPELKDAITIKTDVTNIQNFSNIIKIDLNNSIGQKIYDRLSKDVKPNTETIAEPATLIITLEEPVTSSSEQYITGDLFYSKSQENIKEEFKDYSTLKIYNDNPASYVAEIDNNDNARREIITNFEKYFPEMGLNEEEIINFVKNMNDNDLNVYCY